MNFIWEEALWLLLLLHRGALRIPLAESQLFQFAFQQLLAQRHGQRLAGPGVFAGVGSAGSVGAHATILLPAAPPVRWQGAEHPVGHVRHALSAPA